MNHNEIKNLTDICLTYQQSRFYVERIPKKFLRIANKRFKIPSEDTIISFLSCNLFGNGRYGVYFTSSGIYWKNWLVGNGNMKWEELSKVKKIKINKNEYLFFDSKESFNINASGYPPQLFEELIITIKDFINQQNQMRLNDIENTKQPIEIKELDNICKLFDVTEDPTKTNNNLYRNDKILPKKMKKIIKRYYIPEDEKIIAFLDTSVISLFSKGTDGILICKSGIYFKESFVHLYFPWHIFYEIPIELNLDELKIGKENIFHLLHARMSQEDIVLMLNNLKQYTRNIN
ncbi:MULTISPECIES: hypothetical protein [Bacillus cereus group]|uniref:hypothetical protein n=1 Tax=Bacillus cereus group TaxID=86661 RepID=UPI000BEDAC1D|nr:hypothetical protein [Bacillus toyonensis]MED2709023.1 hypothetical protein [Bacillus toyonensis]MED2742344.1 hypothetical protein [Bacillus toyonensis]PDZ26799.1 hypothetical protein CON85_20490 [Bacillus toyonensis]PEB17040.1 hypothetical protein COO08_19265 [Bacillus toyonensis]PEO28104.1 hypothetical protein CN569_25370 [Bacillus toyonensis]